MTGRELRDALRAAGVTQAAFGARVGRSARTVRRWVGKGEAELPSYVWALFVAHVPERVRAD